MQQGSILVLLVLARSSNSSEAKHATSAELNATVGELKSAVAVLEEDVKLIKTAITKRGAAAKLDIAGNESESTLEHSLVNHKQAQLARGDQSLEQWCSSDGAQLCGVCMYCLPCKGSTDADDGCAQCSECDKCDDFAPCFAQDFKNVDCKSDEAAHCAKEDCMSCIPCLSDSGDKACAEGECDKCSSCLNDFAACMVEDVEGGDTDLCASQGAKDCAGGDCATCWKSEDEEDESCQKECMQCLPFLQCEAKAAFLHRHKKHHVRRHAKPQPLFSDEEAEEFDELDE